MSDRLPIYELESIFIAACRDARRLIIQAPTGSGKSTQIPQMLLDQGQLGDGQVVVLQPRRLAARLLAARVARERQTELGAEVGYQIRFDHVAGSQTRIKYVTEGILLRQMVQDPELPGVRALVFDEFHERHLYGDITLAQAMELQATSRPDLLLIVMSATLDAGALERYLAPCPILRAGGRQFPVDIEYDPYRTSPDGTPVWERAADAFAEYVDADRPGDVLVFMPGGFEIAQTIEAIRQRSQSRGFLLLPLHGELPPADQDAAVARYEQRKVVVSTNVAETSLTIDGVRLVIDSGLARVARYDSHRGLNTLLIERISQAAADQRAGRAGRTAPGTCRRLWSAPEHGERAPHETPEIRRLDLTEVVLTLKAAGVKDLRRFRWLDAPPEPALAHAEELLVDLGALHATTEGPQLPEADGETGHTQTEITPTGRRMLAFPVHPRYSRMLLAAADRGCVHQACLVAALTQGRDLLLRNPGREVLAFREDIFGSQAGSDFWVLMSAWNYAARNSFNLGACRKAGIHAVTARQVGPLFEQFLRLARAEGLDVEPRKTPDEALQKCILIGFSDRVARRLDGGTLRCELVHGGRGTLARESLVHHAPLIVVAEVREIEGAEKSVNTVLSLATAITPEWLEELFPEDVREELNVSYDPTTRRVWAEVQRQFRDLLLSTRRIDPPPAEAAARLLAAEVKAGRLPLPNWDDQIEAWLHRIDLLCRHCPELNLPPVTPADRHHLIEQICQGAISFKELKERPVRPVVESWLSAPQRAILDQHAPDRVNLGNGRQPKVVYPGDGSPYVAVRIQELYEVETTPRIAMNRVPLVVHILAPNQRPVQITQDLAGFWRDHYPRVKQELQRRYPKHAWR